MEDSMNRTLVLTAALSVATPLTAQTTIAFDDFDGNSTFDSFLITPDNSSNSGFNGAPGVFPNSNFDVFGITTRDVLRDFADDSATTFPPDSFGIIKSTKLDSFLGAADVQNNDNPSGLGFVDWTADVTGFENLQVSVDMAAIGNFDGDDKIELFASFDGGATDQLLFSALQNDEVFYEIQMEGGTTYDRYFTAFYDGDEWDALINSGQPSVVVDGSTISYLDIDDGTTNGDTAANDGFVPVESLNGVIEERAYNEVNSNGDFNNFQELPYIDPLLVTTAADPTGIQLNNDFQTITADIVGTGEDLLLTLIVENNGSQEVIAFDNVFLTGDEVIVNPGLTGDYDDNDEVGAGDLALVLANWGALVADGVAPDDNWKNAEDVTANDIGADELALVLANWGNEAEVAASLAAISAATGLSENQVLAMVPEPTSLALLGLTLPLVARRRRA
jgi:hypothetical protein